jgi:hypothetical protein
MLTHISNIVNIDRNIGFCFHMLRLIYGKVPEWSNGTDSKSVVWVTAPGVRILSFPPILYMQTYANAVFQNYFT